MKQPTKLTRKMKECCSAADLNWKDWLCVGETEFSYKLIHRQTGRIKSLDKFIYEKGKRR